MIKENQQKIKQNKHKTRSKTTQHETQTDWAQQQKTPMVAKETKQKNDTFLFVAIVCENAQTLGA